MNKLLMTLAVATALFASNAIVAQVHKLDISPFWCHKFKKHVRDEFKVELTEAVYNDETKGVTLLSNGTAFAIVRTPKLTVMGQRPSDGSYEVELIGQYQGAGTISLYWFPQSHFEKI